MLKLYKFYTDWCAPCRALKPIIEETLKYYENTVRLVPINVEEQNDIAKKFNISHVPKLILINDKEEILWQHDGLINGTKLFFVLKHYTNLP